MAKSNNSSNLNYECNPFSIKHNGKALSSSTDTVNPFSIKKSGVAIVKGKNG